MIQEPVESRKYELLAAGDPGPGELVYTSTAHQDGCAAALFVRIADGEDLRFKPFAATGLAKRHPKDTPDTNIGAALALARAMREAADYLTDQANAAVAKASLQRLRRLLLLDK